MAKFSTEDDLELDVYEDEPEDVPRHVGGVQDSEVLDDSA